MTKYDLIVEELQNQYDSGLITLESANEVNTIAFTDYLFEMAMDNGTITEYFDITEAVTRSSFEAKSIFKSSQVYIDAIKKSTDNYKSSMGNIKCAIKEKRFKEALNEIEDCEGMLRELKHLVKETPESITENELIHISKTIGKALIATTLFSVIFYMWRTYDETHNGIIEMKEVKVKPNKGEKNAVADPEKQVKYQRKSPLESAKDEGKRYAKEYLDEQKEMLPITAAIIALTTLATRKKIGSVNEFKTKAIKGIDSELKALTKLRKKCIKLKEKTEKTK